MSGADDAEGLDGKGEATTKTPSFADELKRPDLWRQVTPIPNFDSVSIDAEYEANAGPTPGETEADDLAAAAWEEIEEVLDGDGPFAVPMDGPAPESRVPPHLDLMDEAFGAQGPGVPLGRSPRDLNLDNAPRSPATPRPGLEPHVLERRAPRRPPRPPPAGPAPEPKTPSARRTYPRMLALLKDRTVAAQPAQPPAPRPPPVPGTFFPAPREPMEQPEPSDLDQMLLTMAEGLLIGETAEGHKEVRVTLKDEFFAGTELRIVLADGKVQAQLAPPDREVYWQLNASLEDLHQRLADRGLTVESLELLDP